MVGGGLAGLTAALDLAEAGLATTLVEKRPFVGGKTFSFNSGGVELDNGQHVYLRCCTAYLALVERLGLRDSVRTQPRLRVPVLDPVSGRTSAITARPLPAPLHLAASIVRYTHLSWREKLRLGRAVIPILRLDTEDRRRLDGESFGTWLRARGQSQRAIDHFWDLIILPTCNDRSENVSARQAIMVLQVGLLRGRHAADIGFATVGLSQIADAVLARFQQRGGQALLGRAARGVRHEGEHASGIYFADGTTVEADAMVLALPPNQTRALLPDAWRADPAFASLDAFSYAPIVNVHVQLDRPVMAEWFCAVLDSDVQYVFNRSRIAGTDGNGQWLTCSISGAFQASQLKQADVAANAIAGLRRALPAARGAAVLRWRVVKEQEATFRPQPGTHSRRLGTKTPYPNLLLAGAWTDTEWPATMESAVRSGHNAARAWLTKRNA